MPARKQTSRSAGAKKSSSKKKSRTSGARSSTKKAPAKRTKRKKTSASSGGAAAATQTALADVARSIGSTLGSITARAKKVVKQAAERLEQE